jgi:DNA-binding YbaB/EbfC family protein
MFEGIKDMGKLLQQANEMKKQMSKVQEELKNLNFTGATEGGKIQVIVNGEIEVKDIIIDEDFLKKVDKNKLQKALKEAISSAIKQSKETAASKLSGIAGGLNLPGL